MWSIYSWNIRLKISLLVRECIWQSRLNTLPIYFLVNFQIHIHMYEDPDKIMIQIKMMHSKRIFSSFSLSPPHAGKNSFITMANHAITNIFGIYFSTSFEDPSLLIVVETYKLHTQNNLDGKYLVSDHKPTL